MNKLCIVFAAAVVLSAAVMTAQAPEPTGIVVGSGNFFSPIVSDLDKALAFYRDGLKLDVQGAPSNADENQPLRNMFGLPNARLRWSIARPAGMRTGVEIVEIKDAGGKPAERRMQDSGAVTLILFVRDINAILGRMKTIGATIVSSGGAPLEFPGRGGVGRAVMLKDPDGHFVELYQPASSPGDAAAANASDVTAVRVRLTVDDASRALQLYQQLGVSGTLDAMYTSNPTAMRMFGLPAEAQYRVANMTVPTSGLTLEFIEFKGLDRKPVRSNIQDPGSTRMQIQVRDVDAAIARLKAANGTVVSTGGTTVDLPGRGGAVTKTSIVRDPNNLFLVLIQTAPPRTP
jgi:predicted enzyme related to lactoylglutathione lyase